MLPIFCHRSDTNIGHYIFPYISLSQSFSNCFLDLLYSLLHNTLLSPLGSQGFLLLGPFYSLTSKTLYHRCHLTGGGGLDSCSLSLTNRICPFKVTMLSHSTSNRVGLVGLAKHMATLPLPPPWLWEMQRTISSSIFLKQGVSSPFACEDECDKLKQWLCLKVSR